MSVVVVGMEMPTNCLQCSFVRIVSDHHYCGCNANCMLGEYVGEYFEGVGRHEGCPLVELPSGHGDLIDRDALPKDRVEWDDIVDAEVVVEGEDEL